MAASTDVMMRNIIFAGRNLFPRHVSSIYYNQTCKRFVQSRSYCSAAPNEDLDPAPLFLNKEVQSILRTLTKPDHKKIFRRKKDGRSLEEPVYKFMTDAQLAEARQRAEHRMWQLLQMPPVVKVKPETNEILSKDPELQGLTDSKIVFTDITFGIKDDDRFIVIRETDGTLRSAYNDERKRIQQVFFDFPGREMVPPKMFSGECLQDLLDRQEYEFILDRACIQYDPHELDWERVTREVYERINKEKHFDKLTSTRHYGPMVFYLAWNKIIDDLFFESLKKGLMEDAVMLVQLYHKIHPDCKSVNMEKSDDYEFLLNYVRHDSPNRGKLEMAVQMYKEIENEKRKLAENVKKAHGAE